MPSILFVCLGNICRSPAAEAILRHYALQEGRSDIYVESSGVGSWHIGHLPDSRMVEAANKRGIIMASRAQQFQLNHFDKFDYIFAADQEVLDVLHQYAKTLEQKSKLHLLTVYSQVFKDEEVPDPYYTGDEGFELVLDILDDSCKGILLHIS